MLMMHWRSGWHGAHRPGIGGIEPSVGWSLTHDLLLVHKSVNARRDHANQVKCLWLGGGLGYGHLGVGLG